MDDGRIGFRLWAPGAKKVELCLQGRAPETHLTMAAEAGGWFGTTTGLAGSGFYYQYRIDGERHVPDPASRYQPQDIDGSSQIIDPEEWYWRDTDWKGLPWEEAVFYELHVGTFSKQGTFAGVKERLDYLVDLGVTAIQLMPIADFPGRHNWGYDGVLPFAPDSSYGTPGDLKDLIETAHRKGLMVFNDVVYGHFGPEGNYLHLYAPTFFTDRHRTPWGDAVNFDPKHDHWVRRFFIHNALYWLEEYHFDGLRLDAVHTLFDDTTPDILEELAEAVRMGPGYDRQIYLVLENDHNAAHYLRRNPFRQHRYFDAQWNDDLHHVLHVLLTGETDGYYRDYKLRPMHHLGRCLTEGFAYQGETSIYRSNQARGEPCSDLPLTSFISFLQNHDQIGNRAAGERISELCPPAALKAATVLLLLSPSPPLLFMGQEWASREPFTYFVDFHEELGHKVNEGRLQEFEQFPWFSEIMAQAKIPLPNTTKSFLAAKLVWDELNREPHRQWLELHRELLHLRRREISPRIKSCNQADYRLMDDKAMHVQWYLNDGSTLMLAANLGNKPAKADCHGRGKVLFATADDLETDLEQGVLPPWSVIFYLEELRK